MVGQNVAPAPRRQQRLTVNRVRYVRNDVFETEARAMADSRVYTSPVIAVHWQASRCIHAARCIAGAPGVFDPRRRPWVVLDGADPDLVADVVRRCPSG